MNQKVAKPYHTRLGFHYFPDTVHYRQSDLQTWLPELQMLGARWLTLLAPLERAIPEAFLRGLLEANIQPILHFRLPIGTSLPTDSLKLFFSSYAKYGVRHIALFDSPNVRSRWPSAAWVRDDLVERFLDMYLPLSEMILDEGMTPIFPPLEPGGDFWDLAFLRASLRGIRRRGNTNLLDNLALGAYAWAGNQPLDWGAGGPDRWPGAHPYQTPAGVQDHKGFHIFDWYLAACRQELGITLPIFLLKAGCIIGDQIDPEAKPIDQAAHAERNLALARIVCEDWNADYGMGSIPAEVHACNFWLLASDPQDIYSADAWFKNPSNLFAAGSLNSMNTGSDPLPVVDAFHRWVAENQLDIQENNYSPQSKAVSDIPTSYETYAGQPISHYVLLPLYAWGMAEWDLDLVKPMLQQMHPTVGFSLDEARLAARVTVVGSHGAISDETVSMLHKAGCYVERLLEDGTLIATLSDDQ